jgi:hypothetical protein
MWAILPEGHPKICRKRPIPLNSLGSESFIFVSASEFSGYFQWIQNECIQAGFTPRIVRTTEQPQTALDLVCAGLGVSLLSLPQDRTLDRPGVVVQALAPPVPTFTQNVFYKKTTSKDTRLWPCYSTKSAKQQTSLRKIHHRDTDDTKTGIKIRRLHRLRRFRFELRPRYGNARKPEPGTLTLTDDQTCA